MIFETPCFLVRSWGLHFANFRSGGLSKRLLFLHRGHTFFEAVTFASSESCSMAVDLQGGPRPQNASKPGIWEQTGATSCPSDLLDILNASILHTSFKNKFWASYRFGFVKIWFSCQKRPWNCTTEVISKKHCYINLRPRTRLAKNSMAACPKLWVKFDVFSKNDLAAAMLFAFCFFFFSTIFANTSWTSSHASLFVLVFLLF